MFPVMKNGKGLYCPKGRRGSKGEPAVPPSLTHFPYSLTPEVMSGT